MLKPETTSTLTQGTKSSKVLKMSQIWKNLFIICCWHPKKILLFFHFSNQNNLLQHFGWKTKSIRKPIKIDVLTFLQKHISTGRKNFFSSFCNFCIWFQLFLFFVTYYLDKINIILQITYVFIWAGQNFSAWAMNLQFWKYITSSATSSIFHYITIFSIYSLLCARADSTKSVENYAVVINFCFR